MHIDYVGGKNPTAIQYVTIASEICPKPISLPRKGIKHLIKSDFCFVFLKFRKVV